MIYAIDCETLTKKPHSIVEIGITAIDLKSLSIHSTQSLLVAPNCGTNKDNRLKSLTGIDLTKYNQVYTLAQAYKFLKLSIGKQPLIAWGDDIDFLNAQFKTSLKNANHIFKGFDLSYLMTTLFNTTNGTRLSLKHACDYCNVQLEEPWHRAGPDSLSLAKIHLALCCRTQNINSVNLDSQFADWTDLANYAKLTRKTY